MLNRRFSAETCRMEDWKSCYLDPLPSLAIQDDAVELLPWPRMSVRPWVSLPLAQIMLRLLGSWESRASPQDPGHRLGADMDRDCRTCKSGKRFTGPSRLIGQGKPMFPRGFPRAENRSVADGDRSMSIMRSSAFRRNPDLAASLSKCIASPSTA
jgi:hypothetical protein